MPEYAPYYVGHWWFCEKAWGVRCLLRCKWKGGHNSCPLDGIGEWHGRHNENLAKELADWNNVERNDPVQKACAWVENVLDKLNLNNEAFAEFFEELERHPASTALLEQANLCEHVQLCWTAHLIADYACLYWSTATGTEGKYKSMKMSDRKDMGVYVKAVGDIILNRRCPWRKEL